MTDAAHAFRAEAKGNGQVALDLARAGLPVFPCDPDKRPLVKWKEAATADPETVAGWWRQYPAALVGLPTGGRSGVYAADCDIDRETGEAVGEASLAALGCGALLTDPAQPRVRTASGGRHLLFAHPGEGFGNTASKLGPKLDTRGDGGFIIAAGSSGPAGRYTAETAIDWHALPPLPNALRRALAAPERREEPGFRFDAGTGHGWGAAALAGELARVLAAPTGERNATLNRAAFRLGQAVAGGALDGAEVKSRLHAAGLQIGLDPREVAATIESGFMAGLAAPRGPASNRDGAGPRGAADGPGEAPEAAWRDPDPRFLRADLPPAPPLPLGDVLGPRLAAWVRDAAEAKGAPPDYVLAALLAVAGSTIGNARWVAPWRGWAEPPVLWAMCIGLPSAGKSPAIDAAVAPLRRAEAPLRKAAEAEAKAWAERAEVAQIVEAKWKKAVEKAVGDGKPPPSKPAEADAGPAPHLPRLVVNDATVERLGVIVARQPRGTLQMRDELAGWLEGMVRYSGGGSDRPFWLEAYGGRPFTVERQSREPLTIDRLTVGVAGGIQPDRLKSLLFKADDDGLLARFLPIWPDPAPVKRPAAWGDDAIIDGAVARLLSLELVTDDEGEARPWFIPFADDARDLMDAFRSEVRAWEAEAEGLMLSFIGKLPGLAARLSLVLAYLDWAAEGGEEPRAIGAADFGRAAHLVEAYVLPMARRAYADASVPKPMQAARRLAGIIRAQGWRDFTSRDVLRLDRERLGTAAELNPALAMLADGEVIRLVDPPAKPQGGRPPRRYIVNPALHRGQT